MNVPDRRSKRGMRRQSLKVGAAVATLTLGPRIALAEDQNWATFKRELTQNGERVVDPGNKDVSHSESQGWGMLFAENNGDKDAFQKLWQWTSATLQRGDGVFSWRWSPKAAEPGADKNNAADGDMLLAWALARAAESGEAPRGVRDGGPPYDGLDAVRIPLYLAGRKEQARIGRFLSAWQTPLFGGKPPAWINLKDGSVAPFPSSGGYDAVLALTQFVSDGMLSKPPFATLIDADDYYSASLKLLSNIAVREPPLAKRP